MGKTHREQAELAKELAAANLEVEVGARYVHYKGAEKIYKVVGLGFLEANDELCVMYESQYGERLIFLRPLTSWLETVEWDGATVKRFTKL